LADDAGLFDRRDERSRAAVHDRNFRAVDFDGGVIDAHAPAVQQSTCSAVDTSGPSRSPSTVANSVEITDSAVAETFAVASLKAGADKNKTCIGGCRSRVRLTGKPEWTPTPVTVAASGSVVCRLNFILEPPTKLA